MLQRKQLLGSDDELKKELLNGINKMANAVGSTLGPKGKTVLIQDDYGQVKATKDGVTVAKNIVLENNVQNMAATVLKEASMRTNTNAGDGTTTATVLARSIINLGYSYKKDVGIDNIHLFKKGIEDAAELVYQFIDDNSQDLDIKNTELLNSVATISANNDSELGNLLGHAFQAVGENGVITIAEGKSFETNFELVKGYRFNRGYSSPSFITNDRTKKVELDDCFILIVGEKISDANQIFTLIEQTKSNLLNSNLQLPYLIICDDIDERALQLFVVNNLRGNAKLAVVKSPGINLDRKDLLLDLAKVTGATILGKDYGKLISEANAHCFGISEKVEIDKDTCTLINPASINEGPIKEALNIHIENVKYHYEEKEEGFLKEQIKTRIARLSEGIGIFYAGGSSDIEIYEKIDRIDDALHALHAAISEGVIPGGGSLLTKASKIKQKIEFNKDHSNGFSVLLEAIKSPLWIMLSNSGVSPKDIVNAVANSTNNKYGYNVLLDKYEDDMISAGIIDSAKVVKTALKNAVSVAGTFLTTEYAIVNSNYMQE